MNPFSEEYFKVKHVYSQKENLFFYGAPTSECLKSLKIREMKLINRKKFTVQIPSAFSEQQFAFSTAKHDTL